MSSSTDEKVLMETDVISIENGQFEISDHKNIDHVLERRVCRKLDIRILPFIALMYLCNWLDKGNMANAKTDGIENDLNITGNQWNVILSVLFIPFVLFCYPFTYFIKKFNAANVMPLMMIGFGSVCTLGATAWNFGSFLVVRFFIGAFESAFLPGIIYYLTTFYRRGELGRRLSIFYSAANIANAFSGLLSYGIFQIDSSHIKGYQILFIIEGLLTIVCSGLCYLALPRDIHSCKFLNEEEKKCAIWRIETDSSSSNNAETSIKKGAIVLKHPITYAWVLQEIFISVPINSMLNWFPQIIGNLVEGKVMTNLYTVAPNVWGAISLLILCFSSDLLKVRFAFILISIGITLIGFIVFAAIDIKEHTGAAYFTCFLMSSGAAASSVLTSTWYNNNIPNDNSRAFMTCLGVSIGNAAGLVSANIFLTKDAPKYLPALEITAAFGACGFITVSSIVLFMYLDNKKRNKMEGVNLTYRDVPTSELKDGFFSPKFRWMY